MLLITFTLSTPNDTLFRLNILAKAKFTTNVINNSLKKCWQIMKIPKTKYLKVYLQYIKKITNVHLKNLVKTKHVI